MSQPCFVSTYLIDLDLVKSVGEVFVVGKSVPIIDVFAFWYLGQHSRLTAGQRLKQKIVKMKTRDTTFHLQSSPHLPVLDVSLILHLL